jgi:hypothetical protein
MASFSEDRTSHYHHAGRGFMHVGKDIHPHHQSIAIQKRGYLTPTKQVQLFKYTFREELYSDPHYNPTSLAFTNKEVKRRATLVGVKIPQERREALLALSKKRNSPALVSKLSTSSSTSTIPVTTSKVNNKWNSSDLYGQLNGNKQSIADRVLERQTDVTLYTGIHRYRFDHRTGEGRGKAGRDSMAKGRGNVPVNVCTLSRNFLYYKKHGVPDFKLPPRKKVPNFNKSKNSAREEVMKHCGHLLHKEFEKYDDKDDEMFNIHHL